MKKWLEQQGATFAPGKGSHLNVFLNGKKSVLPMHGVKSRPTRATESRRNGASRRCGFTGFGQVSF
jgi:hypothetical protein